MLALERRNLILEKLQTERRVVVSELSQLYEVSEETIRRDVYKRQAGAQCDHVNHVSTQLPYAMLAAAVSFVTYLVAGFVKTAWIALPVGIVLMVATLMVDVYKRQQEYSEKSMKKHRTFCRRMI